MKLTTAFEARRRIIALLQAQPGLDGVLVTRGAPTEEIQSGRELIYFGDSVTDHDAEFVSLGADRRDEDYLLELNVYVFQEGDDEDATEARCEALCDEIATALQGDLTLGQLLKQALEADSFEQATNPVGSPEGWRATAEISLRCQALIRP